MSLKPFILTDNGIIYLGHLNGAFAITLDGDFGGGTVEIQRSYEEVDESYRTFTDEGSYTAPNEKVLVYSGFVRLKLSGATNPNLKAVCDRINNPI